MSRGPMWPGAIPGQRETTVVSEATMYRLVVRQVRRLAIWSCLIVLLMQLCAVAFWVRADHLACWSWIVRNWPWLLVPHVGCAIAAFALGCWRFMAEIADPSYPTPRQPVPAEWQRDGPRLPWSRDLELEEEPQPASERVVKVEFDDKAAPRAHRQFAWLPDAPGLPAFARAAGNGRAFSEAEAHRHGLSRREFNDLRDAFRERGWVTWKDARYKHQGLATTAAGRAVLRHLAEHSPTSPSVREGEKVADRRARGRRTYDLAYAEEEQCQSRQRSR